MEEMRKERRKFPRIDVELFVRYKLLTASEQNLQAQTKNISSGGVCLVTRERIEPGTVLAMDIRFPHSRNPVMFRGRVIWSNESRLGPSPAGHPRFDNGVEFFQINDSERNLIMDRIKSEQEKAKGEDWKIGIVRNIPKS